MAEFAGGGVIPGYGKDDDTVRAFLDNSYVLPRAAAAVLNATGDTEPASSLEYICPRCERGQCARCRDTDCGCCAGNEDD